MLKEIFEQPQAIRDTLRGRLLSNEGVITLSSLREHENKFLKAAFNSSVKRINYFRVFNRMGKLVYEIVNADPSAIKWDGTYNNIMQESDGYMWIAEITGLGAVTFERKSGQFLLLK